MMNIVLSAALVLAVTAPGTAGNVSDLSREARNGPRVNHDVAPRTYYVAPSPLGNDSNPGTSTELAWATPQKAANTVVAGDTVFVTSGTYTTYPGTKHVLWCVLSGSTESPIVFMSDGPPGTVVFDNGNSDEVVRISSHTILDGFTIRNGFTGVRADGADGVVVRNCNILDMQSHGVHLSRTANSQVLENMIHDQKAHADSSGHCVYLEKSHAAIQNENHVIRGNMCYKWAGTAIVVSPYGSADGRSAGITIENNTCYQCPRGGIRVSNVSDTRIQNNLCYSIGIKGLTGRGLIEVCTEYKHGDDPDALAPQGVIVSDNTCVSDDGWHGAGIDLDHTGHARDTVVFNNACIVPRRDSGIRDHGMRSTITNNFVNRYRQSLLDSTFVDPGAHDYRLKSGSQSDR